jgi:hypothetical protein
MHTSALVLRGRALRDRRSEMDEQPIVERLEVEGRRLAGYTKDMVKAGNRSEVRVTKGERTLVTFPLTVGVVAAVFAPALVVAGVAVALAAGCAISVERVGPPKSPDVKPESSATAEADWLVTESW